MKLLLYVLFVFLLIVPAVAESPNVVLTLVDALTKEPISDVFVEVNLEGSATNYFLEAHENLKLSVTDGDYHAKLVVNDPTSQSSDYYGEIFLEIEGTHVEVIYLYPVGSIEGFVTDKLNNVVSGAELKFDCNNVFTMDYPQETDSFGSFSLPYVPIGKCTIFGRYQGITGSVEIHVIQGESTDGIVQLEHVVIETDANQQFFLIILFVGAGVLLYLLFKKKRSKQNEEPMKDTVVSSRSKDILKTLRMNEKKIVTYLLEQKDAVHLSKIHYKTGISKGALFRNLKSLEEKDIVETSKEGRVRKVKLSRWFKGE